MPELGVPLRSCFQGALYQCLTGRNELIPFHIITQCVYQKITKEYCSCYQNLLLFHDPITGLSLPCKIIIIWERERERLSWWVNSKCKLRQINHMNTSKIVKMKNRHKHPQVLPNQQHFWIWMFSTASYSKMRNNTDFHTAGKYMCKFRMKCSVVKWCC